MSHIEIIRMVEALFVLGLSEADIGYFVRAEVGKP